MGINFWQNELQTHASSPAGMINNFLRSAEARFIKTRTEDQRMSVVWITVGLLNQNVLNRGAVMVEFSKAAEYQAVIGYSVTVTMVYMGMLKRAPEQSGLDYFIKGSSCSGSFTNLLLPLVTSRKRVALTQRIPVINGKWKMENSRMRLVI